MPQFLAELYMSRTDGREAAGQMERARQAASELGRDGIAVELVRSIYVPDEELCFFLYEAQNEAAVRSALLHAGLPAERISEAVAPT